jgi:23S rRNA (uridine2552-2'-O)-methyltransferase
MVSKSGSKTNSSKRWLERQHSDLYVQRAKAEGYRSRAAYKLLEMNQRDKLLRKGMMIVDLGAAPGGWSQVAAKEVSEKGLVYAVDILPMESIKGVDIVMGDFQKPEVVEKFILGLEGKSVDLVMSDMAPNLSGIAAADQSRSVNLAEAAMAFAEQVLRKEGVFLVKIFQGSGFEEYLTHLKSTFKQVMIRKPKASRTESREVYLLAKGYQPH